MVRYMFWLCRKIEEVIQVYVLGRSFLIGNWASKTKRSMFIPSLFNCLIFNIRFSSSVINGKQCKHCSLLGKFSNNVIELVTARSHYWIHLFYLLWFKMSSVAHSKFLSFCLKKLVHFNQTKICMYFMNNRLLLSRWAFIPFTS